MLNDTIVYEQPAAKRIVIIGDVHGDMKRFKNILSDAQIINDHLEWIANPPETIVVQLGDQIDSANRYPDAPDWEVLEDINMLYFTHSLNNIAKAKGGKIISLIGNHELMNIIGNFSYVSPKSNFPSRNKYFEPKGTLSNILAHRPIVLKIGQLFFCHAGIRKHHLDILDAAGKDISYLNDLWYQFMSTARIDIKDKDIFDKVILDPTEGILWTRNVDDDSESDYVLQKIGCKYVFIGHTPVERVQIFKDRLWYVDTCISRAFGGASYQYVDINDYTISVKTLSDM